MKKIFFIFVGLLVYNHYCFAEQVMECPTEKLDSLADEYFYNNQHKQFDVSKINDENEKREARIRNACFWASESWHWFCAMYEYCKLCENGKCINMPADAKFAAFTFREYCSLAKTDCFTEDIDKIFSLMQSFNEYNFFLPNMNDVIKDIVNGNEKIILIDTDNSICYRTDDNGDTVWHAFIRSHNDSVGSWANLCASYLKFDKFSNALYNIKNKKGVSAFKEAFDSNDTTNELFRFLSVYAKQEGVNYDNLVNDISKSNNISVTQVKKLITK